ncbi:D-alanine--D-alanine ligase [Xiashengella succiniciproducens]|jgi:D-alanine-D-alanine ligase|uniref:D-alanine--D-alanine ligase n=1 Tax=Xiashengella succiniciproducens TaxID=2949635 RepID=A0A9J6ZNX8_9BACT|nr:D-alanine--D-alanine ligase [Alkaliflexus sp. Ai-910]URW79347.1 D-alanine--D-alanine ligase [Alkaliflexus sp. Ai-910]
MDRRNIAVIYGGYSSEEVVSRKSAEGVLSFIDKDKYNLYPVLITRDKWSVELNGSTWPVDKAEFSAEINGQKVSFDFAYITIHGTPAEDGILQGYLKMLNVPHSTCDVLAAAVTFNKFVCNHYLKSFGVNVANSVLLRQSHPYEVKDIALKTGFPCFVKPNAGGSSFGVTKVRELSELEPAIKKAFKESDEVIIEQFLEGTEVTCGLYKTAEKAVIFPITEVVSTNEFFDFEAKYTPGKAHEITPARISDELTLSIRKQSSIIYDLIGCKGIVRMDYIISDNRPFLLEVNTTPGMTITSFIPQQIRAAGMDIKEVFTDVIEDCIARHKG